MDYAFQPLDGIPRRGCILGAMAVALLTATLMVSTSPLVPMGWDEGNAIHRAEGVSRWLLRWWRLDNATEPRPWSAAAIAADWQYTTRVEGHPAGYGVVIAAGRAVAPKWLDPLTQARLGPMVLFSIAVAAVFYRLRRDGDAAAAAGAVAALLLMPRMFAHAHYASIDGPLTSCWLLTWAFFPTRGGTLPRSVLWGAILGLTLSTKATGWLAPLPFVVWAAICRDRATWRTLALGIPVALATFVLMNPPLWHGPFQGATRFADLNLHRQQFNISTQFLGQMYNLDHPLPWYNTLVIVGATVPSGILALVLIGIAAMLRQWRQRPRWLLIGLSAALLLVVRATPWAPPHDAERLILPSFAFLAATAGIGTQVLWRWRREASIAGGEGSPGRWAYGARAGQAACRAAVVLVFLGSSTSLLWYAPQWLSYYSLLVGGLRGATALGMEPTYYWDALDQKAIRWINQNTGAGEKVFFAAPASENLELLQRWGVLRAEYRAAAPGRWRWYVIQRRPSAWQPLDQWLLRHGRPAYQTRIRTGGWGPWRLDVPLLDVYPCPE